MVKTQVVAAAAALFVCASLSAQTVVKWEQAPMDGHRTGVTIPSTDNVDEALGTFKGKTYIAPNGKKYRKGATPQAARLMREAQPAMAFVKEYIGNCPTGISRRGGTGNLGYMIVDALMAETEKVVGRKVDVGLINSGGIRADMPQGDVLLDDIISMLPFFNYACYLSVKGSDLYDFLNNMASRGHMQPMGGIQVEIKDRVMTKCLVGGEPIDPEKIYGFATIDFLLAGGDGISAAKNAQEVIITETLLRDAFLPYLRQLTAEGKNIEYPDDGRVKIENTRDFRGGRPEKK